MENKLIYGKRGIFLTFIAISIISAFIIIFTPYDIKLGKDASVIKTRVSNVNDYVLDLENVYLERTLESTGTKVIISLIRYMRTQDKFLTDFDVAFKEVFLNGTIDNINIDDIIEPDVMTGNNFNDWISKINDTAGDVLNVETNINAIHANDIEVYQIRPFFVNVDVNITINVSSETSSWYKNVSIKTEINIERFLDPFYLLNTDGGYENNVIETDITLDGWNVENVSNYIRNGTYVHFDNSDAPSFLMRFTNDILPSSCCGIKSLVNPNELSSLSLPSDLDVSYVDYIFWTTTPNCESLNLYTIDEISTEFSGLKFDFEHLALYNIFSSAQQICPPPE